MLVEHIAGLLDELEVEVKSMRNNAVNIEFLQERTKKLTEDVDCLLYTSPSPRDRQKSRMPSSA